MIQTGSKRAGSRWRLALLFFVLGLAACAPGPEPASTRLPAPSLVTTAPEATPWRVARPTLPPTWTPTSTYTPPPPSLTPSPTGTPSVTPTLSPAERCARLWLYGHPAQGAQLSIKDFDQVSFLWQYPLAGESVTLTVTRAGTDLARTLNVPGPNNVAASIPFRVLYGPGLYRWSLVPEDADDEPVEACRQEGSFAIVILRREEHRWPLPEEAQEALPAGTTAPTETAEASAPAVAPGSTVPAETAEPSATPVPPGSTVPPGTTVPAEIAEPTESPSPAPSATRSG